MCFFPTLSHFFFSIILLQARSDSYIESRTIMGMWFLFLVPLLIMVVVLGNRYTSGSGEEEEVRSGTYRGEEE